MEDLLDEMIGLEIGNPNVLENWYNLKVRFVELLTNSEKVKEEKEEVKKNE